MGLEAAAVVVVVEAFVVAVLASLALAGLRVVKVAPEMNKMFVFTKKSNRKLFSKYLGTLKSVHTGGVRIPTIFEIKIVQSSSDDKLWWPRVSGVI